MAKYVRKTTDEWEIRGKYNGAWECVNTETTRKDAVRSIREYRENEPGTAFTLKKLRVKITPKESV